MIWTLVYVRPSGKEVTFAVVSGWRCCRNFVREDSVQAKIREIKYIIQNPSFIISFFICRLSFLFGFHWRWFCPPSLVNRSVGAWRIRRPESCEMHHIDQKMRGFAVDSLPVHWPALPGRQLISKLVSAVCVVLASTEHSNFRAIFYMLQGILSLCESTKFLKIKKMVPTACLLCLRWHA